MADGELWQNGRRVARCKTRKDASNAHYVLDIEPPVPDGDYELTVGPLIREAVRCKNGECTKILP
jgi:hypothetical protein